MSELLEAATRELAAAARGDLDTAVEVIDVQGETMIFDFFGQRLQAVVSLG